MGAPYENWINNGTFDLGIFCKYAHAGFPTSEKRCIICGKSGHDAKECTRPGGGNDPNQDAAWTEYRKRQEAIAPATPAPSGKGKEGKKGKGKGKGGKKEQKGTEPKGGEATAKARRLARAPAGRLHTSQKNTAEAAPNTKGSYGDKPGPERVTREAPRTAGAGEATASARPRKSAAGGDFRRAS